MVYFVLSEVSMDTKHTLSILFILLFSLGWGVAISSAIVSEFGAVLGIIIGVISFITMLFTFFAVWLVWLLDKALEAFIGETKLPWEKLNKATR